MLFFRTVLKIELRLQNRFIANCNATPSRHGSINQTIITVAILAPH